MLTLNGPEQTVNTGSSHSYPPPSSAVPRAAHPCPCEGEEMSKMGSCDLVILEMSIMKGPVPHSIVSEYPMPDTFKFFSKAEEGSLSNRIFLSSS